MRFVAIAPGPIETKGAWSRLDPTGEMKKKMIGMTSSPIATVVVAPSLNASGFFVETGGPLTSPVAVVGCRSDYSCLRSCARRSTAHGSHRHARRAGEPGVVPRQRLRVVGDG